MSQDLGSPNVVVAVGVKELLICWVTGMNGCDAERGLGHSPTCSVPKTGGGE